MKVNITNLYGMSGQSTALIAQNDVTKLAKQLGFNELSFYFYDIYSDSQSELSRRLDGRLWRCRDLPVADLEWPGV